MHNIPAILNAPHRLVDYLVDPQIVKDRARFGLTLAEEATRGTPLKEDRAYRVTQGFDRATAEQVCTWFQQTEVFQSIMRNRPYGRRSHALFVPSRHEREQHLAVDHEERLMAPEYTTLSTLHMDIAGFKAQFPCAEGHQFSLRGNGA